MLPPGCFIANTGLLRMGKTMNATRLAAIEYLQGRAVYTNYDTSFSNRLQNMAELFSIPQGSCLVLDELQSMIDSREFSDNIGLTHWLTMLGKDGISLIYTVQGFGMVDLRLRQLTGYLYFAERKMHVNIPARTTSILALYQVSPSGDAIRLKRIKLRHALLRPLYNTFDKNVVLGQGEGDIAISPVARAAAKAAAKADKKGGSAPGKYKEKAGTRPPEAVPAFDHKPISHDGGEVSEFSFF